MPLHALTQDPICRHPSILIIDDDSSVRIALQQMLCSRYHVASAGTMDEGLENLERLAVDAIILDLFLPGRNGIEGLRDIRKTHPALPVLILTGYPSFDTAIQALRNGATDYLEKPIAPNVLENRLHLALEHPLPAKDSIVPPHLKPSLKSTPGPVPREDLLEMLHDISNPLLSLNLTSHQLRSLLETPTRHPGLPAGELLSMTGQIESQLQYLGTLVNFWRDAELARSNCQPDFSLQEIFRLVQDQLSNRLKSTKIELQWIGPSTRPVRTSINSVFLVRILTNLLDNAISAVDAETGKIRIIVRRTSTLWQFRVEDNGCGIPPENLLKIFQKSWTSKPDAATHGLGLCLVEKTARLMGGRVFVSSVPGEGSRFVLNIPRSGP